MSQFDRDVEALAESMFRDWCLVYDKVAGPWSHVEEPTREIYRMYARRSLMKSWRTEIEKEYKFGNITRLGAANYMQRAGYNQRFAIEFANKLPKQ